MCRLSSKRCILCFSINFQLTKPSTVKNSNYKSKYNYKNSRRALIELLPQIREFHKQQTFTNCCKQRNSQNNNILRLRLPSKLLLSTSGRNPPSEYCRTKFRSFLKKLQSLVYKSKKNTRQTISKYLIKHKYSCLKSSYFWILLNDQSIRYLKCLFASPQAI